MSVVIEKANEFIVPIIEKNGYEVVEVACEQKYGELNITFYIYAPDGIRIEDCEKVTALLDQPLEEYDITEGKPYVLNVSSPGLDRPIITPRDFERSMGTEVEILFIKPEGKKKKAIGTLLANDEEKVTILSQGKEKQIAKTNISKVQPYIKF